MREAIYTIPIHEIFGETCGCPVCRLYAMLEKRCTEYIMGAAMMEPDIRIETNRYGFCGTHLHQMMKMKNRLSLALMLETRMDELMKHHMPPAPVKKGAVSPVQTCFVCREVDSAARKLLATALSQYASDSDFRKLFREQEFFCMKHYALLCELADAQLPRKVAAECKRDLTAITQRYAAQLREDVHAFSTMFDYRNAASAKENEQIKTAIDRTVQFME